MRRSWAGLGKNIDFSINDEQVTIYLDPNFKPKTIDESYGRAPLVLKAFLPAPRTREERRCHLSCLVRAVRIYLERTAAVRKSERLLVSAVLGVITTITLMCARWQTLSWVRLSLRMNLSRGTFSLGAELIGDWVPRHLGRYPRSPSEGIAHVTGRRYRSIDSPRGCI